MYTLCIDENNALSKMQVELIQGMFFCAGASIPEDPFRSLNITNDTNQMTAHAEGILWVHNARP